MDEIPAAVFIAIRPRGGAARVLSTRERGQVNGLSGPGSVEVPTPVTRWRTHVRHRRRAAWSSDAAAASPVVGEQRRPRVTSGDLRRPIRASARAERLCIARLRRALRLDPKRHLRLRPPQRPRGSRASVQSPGGERSTRGAGRARGRSSSGQDRTFVGR